MSLAPAVLLPAIYARTLTAGEVAAWLYAYGLGNYVTVFHLGIGTSISAQVAREISMSGRAAFLVAGMQLTSVVAAVVGAGMLALGYFGLFDSTVSMAIEWDTWFMLLAAASTGTALILPLNALSGYCIGTFEVARLVPIMVLQKASLVVLCALAALLFQNALHVSMAHLLSGAITVAALFAVSRRLVQPVSTQARMLAGARRRAIVSLALPAAVSGVAQLPLINLHVLLVGRYAPDTIVSFVVVSSGLALLYGMAWSILGNLLPVLSASRPPSGGFSDAGDAPLPIAVCLCGLALIAASVGIACALPGAVGLAVTDTFARASVAGLVAYAVALMARLVTLPWGLAFYAGGHPWAGIVPTLTEAAASVVLALLLLPAYGLSGLAGAVVLSALLHAVIAWVLLARCGLVARSRARPFVAALGTLAVCGAVAAAGGIAWGAFVETGKPLHLAMGPVCFALAIGAVFLIGYWHLVLPPEARRAVVALVLRLVRRLASARRGMH